jgi:hypothetical protein
MVLKFDDADEFAGIFRIGKIRLQVFPPFFDFIVGERRVEQRLQ